MMQNWSKLDEAAGDLADTAHLTRPPKPPKPSRWLALARWLKRLRGKNRPPGT